MDAEHDFESFWKKFLADHPSALNRWAHVAALAAGVGGLGVALARRSALPAVVGVSAAAALAVGGHPVFQGDRPKNFGKPIWAARAFLRLSVRTITGAAGRELADMAAAQRKREPASDT
jgi:hypothetical protein